MQREKTEGREKEEEEEEEREEECTRPIIRVRSTGVGPRVGVLLTTGGVHYSICGFFLTT